MGIQQVAATARFIDGNEHIVTVSEVGLANANSVAASFRQACICRGWVAETLITGDVIRLKAIPFAEASAAKMRTEKRLDPQRPAKAQTLWSLTDRYLRSIQGTAQARELSGLLVKITRAT